MNKLEDFTQGSEWLSISGVKLKFHSFDKRDGLPLFTCDEKHPFELDRKGLIGFGGTWKHFKKVDK